MRGAFFHSTIMRLALALLVVQVAALALGLTVIHRFTEATILADARTAAEVARDDLVDAFRLQGEAGLRDVIQRRLDERVDRNFIVLFQHEDGRRIVGNLRDWPPTVSAKEKWRRIWLYRQGAATAEPMGILVTPLPGGYRLLTGEVLEAQHKLATASKEAFLYALALGLLIALLVAATAVWILARQIDVFTHAANAFVGGRLDTRVERDRTGDAFDRLAHAINAMFARIEALVGELRMITDSMAHDLRSPVSRMKAVLERALGRTDDPQAVAALAGAIEEADSLHRLLDTALEISRAEAGIARGQFTRFALQPLLDDLAEIYGPLAEEEGFAVLVEMPTPIDVLAHREMLLRALSNLIDNALKYAEGGSAITLSAKRDEGTLQLSVTDDGPGIAAERIPEATKRFVRLDPARGGSGAGLGLALADTIARLHGGTILIKGNYPHGLIVRLCLPILADDRAG